MFKRSFLFVPADKQRMLDKIESIESDAFILDLEDSVSSQNKSQARQNISKVMSLPVKRGRAIGIRINELTSKESKKDLEETLISGLYCYMIPKFENIFILEEFIDQLKVFEKDRNIKNITKIILMVESSKGILELRGLKPDSHKQIFKRLIGIALGGEDYRESLTISREISRDVLDLARNEIILFASSYGLHAIDTVYPDFKDTQGLSIELDKIISLGFTSKIAIHPSQVGIIDKSFYPLEVDIERMELILSKKDEILKNGAISIGKTMYDMPHLKWALKLKEYINDLNKGKG